MRSLRGAHIADGLPEDAHAQDELVSTPAMAATPLPPLMASRATPAWRAAQCPYLQMEGLAGGGAAVGSQGRRRMDLGEEGGRSVGREAD